MTTTRQDAPHVQVHNVIAGQLGPAMTGNSVDLVDPATGEVFGSAPLSDADDVAAATRAAADAFPGWRDTAPLPGSVHCSGWRTRSRRGPRSW